MPYIVSTLTADNEYIDWISNPGGINIRKEFAEGKSSVLIKGGHGVAQKSGTRGIFTPEGVVTKINDDELEFLMRNSTFLQQVKAGGLKVITKGKPDGTEVSKDMAMSKDTPLTSKDFMKGGRVSTADRITVNGGMALQ